MSKSLLLLLLGSLSPILMRGFKFSFTGTVTGETMKGTADLPIGRKNWTATK
jgi:hypothetical protein